MNQCLANGRPAAKDMAQLSPFAVFLGLNSFLDSSKSLPETVGNKARAAENKGRHAEGSRGIPRALAILFHRLNYYCTRDASAALGMTFLRRYPTTPIR